MQTVIKVENLSKKFRIGRLRKDEGTLRDLISRVIKLPLSKREIRPETETLWALKDINFEVNQGDTVGIVGGNGAGKSTLLKILSRIIKPTTGKVVLAGRVGSLLEVGTGFHQDLTGRENVFLNGAVLGMERRETRKKFNEIVEFAELEKFIDTPVKFYSSGMYLRLAFSVAAHLNPDILIIDEILAVGDTPFQDKCLRKMKEVVSSGKTILFVSHSASMVEKICKTALYLKKGQIENHGETKSILAQYANEHKADEQVKALSRKLSEIKEGEVKFTVWNLIDSEVSQTHSVISREKAIFQFQLVCRQPTANLRFHFSIIDHEGRPIIVASNIAGDKIVDTTITEGIYTLKWICDLPIKAGFYKIFAEVVSRQDNTILDFWNCEPKLEVLPSSDELLADDLQGIVNVPVRFDLERDRI